MRFLSCEPLLGPMDIGLLGTLPREMSERYEFNADRLHWIIVGGESGPGARPCDVEWIRSLVEQGREAGVATFVKQLGRWIIGDYGAGFRGIDRWLLSEDS